MSVEVTQADRDVAQSFASSAALHGTQFIGELARFSAEQRLAGRKEAAAIVGEYLATFSPGLGFQRSGLQVVMGMIDPDCPSPELKLGIPGKVWSAKS